MIFVTVGTHEQPFNRLIKNIDELTGKGILNEDVFIQKGYSDYCPKYCSYKGMLGFDEMNKYAEDARIIITHGGPGSILLSWNFNKVPIVVPRDPVFKEHVDRHQIMFTKRLEVLNKVIAVYDIDELQYKIINFEKTCSEKSAIFSSTNSHFIEQLEHDVEKMFKA